MALALALIFISACERTEGRSANNDDPYSTVLAYIAAVNKKDAEGVQDLINPSYDVGDEVKSRLDRYGGKSLYYVTMQFNGTGMLGATSVDIVLRSGLPSDSQQYKDTFPMSLQSDHWYIDLGRPR